ncbi:Phosphoglycolate phosphatase [Paraburkholderia piptadeniae]|uniref:Phosphoglycolate phosphatase n=1 Tax=Paraburkholderia piptadeniae TaxID=1701573 RepID=A0A1N7SNW9_9BURK|nr:phosphoglycolate phosphatase [Paraburkholderia piptadeniae]SIT49077.1 Phosphoglycolate phosphatase [Paraburkholderia piptadeniae]
MQVMPRKMPIDAVLFDLDGTLLHTSPDIGNALNRALAENGFPLLAPGVAQTLIGGGSEILIDRALTLLGVESRPATLDLVLRRYELCYHQICRDENQLTELYPGTEATLDGLRGMGLKLGVVTNKESRFVDPLMWRFGLHAWFDMVVDGDTRLPRKPDPDPLLHACEALGVDPAHTLFVGDSVTDALAAQAAGMPMVCVSYGYSSDHPVFELPCMRVIDSIGELTELIGGPRTWHRATRIDRGIAPQEMQASQLN